jgi:hypothetical protein
MQRRHFTPGLMGAALLVVLVPSVTATADPGIDAVFNVRNFGATGNGVTDDAQAIRDTVAAAKAAGGGTVYIPAGTYLLASRQAAPGGFGLVQLVNVSNVEVIGDGPTSVVKLKAKDWRTTPEAHAFWCRRCDTVSFRDMRIDGSRDEPGFFGQERMSGVYAFESTSITVDRVRFEHVFGDGVQLVGSGPGDPTQPPVPVVLTQDVVVRDSEFFDNGRSGIGVQGSTRDMQFLDNDFEATSDQDIDFEPTGHRLGPENVLIQGNTMIHSTGAFSVTLGGQTSLVPARHIDFIDNVITNGSMQLFNLDDGLIEGNTLINVSTSPPTPTVNAIGAVTNSTFSDNLFERRSPGGQVVQFSIHSSKRPSGIVLENNEIRHTAGSTGVNFVQTGDGIVVRNNEITGAGGGVGVQVDLSVSDGLTRNGVQIVDNTIRNFDVAAIQLHTEGTARFGVVTMCRNTITDGQPTPTQDVGIRLQLVDVNSVAEAVVCNNIMGTGVVTRVMTNAVTRFRGTGSPEGSVQAPIGSAFIRTDEANRNYRKVANPGGATGWVGQ